MDSPPHPAPSSRQRVRGFGPVALVAAILLGFLFGVLPVWEYVDAHHVPGDTEVQQATVTGIDRGSRGSDRGALVAFALPDGARHSIYFDGRLDRPERGDTIEVYRSGGEWHSPAERSLFGLVSGIGALLLFGALTLGWLRVRRRGSLIPAAPRGRPRPPG